MMQKVYTTERALLWIVTLGIWALLFTPLIVTGSLFFPYTTGKNFFFRIVVEIIFGAWLGLAALRPTYLPRKGIILYAFSAFIGALTLATIFGVDPYRSFWSNLERMEGLVTHLHLFALFLVASSVFTQKHEWTRIFQISLGVSLVVALVGLLESFGVVMLGRVVGNIEGVVRVFSTFGTPTFLAAYTLIHLFVAAYLFIETQSQRLRFAYAAVFLFELYILFASGTRGALLGFAAGASVTGALVLFSARSTFVRRFGVVGVLFIFLLGTGLFAIRNTQLVKSNPFLSRLTAVEFTWSVPTYTPSSTFTPRLMIWNMAWESFKERPVLGWGPENFVIPYTRNYNPHYFGYEEWVDRAHNVFLEWLVAGGVVAFFSYITFLATLGVVVWRLRKQESFSGETAAVFAGLGVAYMVQNLVAFDNISTYLMVALVASFLHVTSYSSKERQVYPMQHYKERRMYLALALAVGGIALAYSINSSPIGVASGIKDVLNTSRAGMFIADPIKKYNDVEPRGSFAMGELRERFALHVITLMETSPENIKREEGIRLLSKAIEEMEAEAHEHPESVRPLMMLGKLYQMRFVQTGGGDDKNAAIGVYTRATELAPLFPQGFIGLAEVYIVGGEMNKAISVVDRIYGHITAPNLLFISTLFAHIAAGDFAGSEKLVTEYYAYREKFPMYADKIHVSKNDGEQAAFRALNKGKPDERERFLIALRDAMGPSSNNAVVFFVLAQTQAELGKKEEARINANRAMAVDPQMRYEVGKFLETID